MREQGGIQYVKVAKVVSDGMPGGSYVELENGWRIDNVLSVKWQLSYDFIPATFIELDDVALDVKSREEGRKAKMDLKPQSPASLHEAVERARGGEAPVTLQGFA
jgi:hypothetical protein